MGKFLQSVAYLSAIAVCGMGLVVIGSTLQQLAAGVGRTPTAIGAVFISRGVGSIVGAASCARLYKWYPGNDVLTVALVCIAVVLLLLPFTVYVTQLHLYFFFLGAGTSVTDLGCQLMTRKLHGANAGPWLGANAAIFGLSAACVPLAELISSSTVTRYIGFAMVAALAASLTAYVSTSEKLRKERLSLLVQSSLSSSSSPALDFQPAPPQYQSTVQWITPQKDAASTASAGGGGGGALAGTSSSGGSHWVLQYKITEICVALMLFCFVGGGVTANAYLITYVQETGTVAAAHKDVVFMVLWLSITGGRLLGIYLQRRDFAVSVGGCTLGADLTSTTRLQVLMGVLCVGGFAAMVAVCLLPRSPLVLLAGTAAYGFFHGPTVGFCHDLNNRLTPLCERGMSIVMLGLVCGASVVPFLTAAVWNGGYGPTAMVVSVGLSALLPLPLIYAAKEVSAVAAAAAGGDAEALSRWGVGAGPGPTGVSSIETASYDSCPVDDRFVECVE